MRENPSESFYHLNELESKSIFIIREAFRNFKNIGVLWSAGKDSTVLLWLCRKAFFGKISFPVIHIDTSFKFKEIYEFRDKYAKEWNLNLVTEKNEKALKEGISPEKGRFECCNALKTQAFKQAIKKQKLNAVLLGIRRDEHGIRGKERVFSPRNKNFQWNYLNQDPEFWDLYKTQTEESQHTRVHPLLDWTELDVWNYIKKENIPVVGLYFSGFREKGKRYRSIGCECCCNPVESNADPVEKIIQEISKTNTSERIGRAQDKEYTMQKLRALGYM